MVPQGGIVFVEANELRFATLRPLRDGNALEKLRHAVFVGEDVAVVPEAGSRLPLFRKLIPKETRFAGQRNREAHIMSAAQEILPQLENNGPPTDIPVLRIEPSSGWVGLKLREVWEYRELLYFLTWRDIKVRYKQTSLGALWAVIQPFFTMMVFSLFFGRLAKVPSDGIPYPVFAYAALLPWNFFANGLSQSSDSLVGSANLIRKVYFPRLAVPLSAVFSGAVDFCIAFLVLLGMMLYYRVTPTLNTMWLPLLLLLALVTSLGVGLWLSALNVQYRDVKYTVPFLTQFWMFATPIAYPSSLLSEPWRTIYGLNPMAGVVEGFRWALLGTKTAPGLMIAVSVLAALALLIGGAFYFRHMEKTFADTV